MGWVADYSASRPGGAALKAAGAVGVVRYVCPGRNDGVNLTAGEYQDLVANGLQVGVVCEFEATWLLRGYQFGHDTALAAKALEQAIGIPDGVTYLAADWDIAPAQFSTALSTLQGWADARGGWQFVRPYGSKGFCEWVQANSPVRGSWSTFAWSFNPVARQFEHAADARLWQYNSWPIPPVPGCDYNDVLGDWGPRTTEDDLTPDQANMLTTCAKAILQLGGAITGLQQQLATATGLIAHGDDTHYSLDHLGKDMAAVLAAVHAAPPGTVDPGLMAAVTAVGAKIDGLKLGVVA